jgi:hypothetical protein
MDKWPATFAGYRAVLTVQEEERLWHGEATVRPRQAVDVHIDGDEHVRAWVHESLSTQAMHLSDIPFAQGRGAVKHSLRSRLRRRSRGERAVCSD